MFVLFFRESEHRHKGVSMGGTEGERERASQAGSMPSTEPDEGLDLTTVRSWPELKSRVGRLTD